MCLSVLAVCICELCIRAWCPQRLEKGTESLKLEFTGGRGPPMCGLLGERCVVLTAEASLQHP